jgi:hypothetical protein
MWRPWYAKAWWGAALTFWSTLFLAQTIPTIPGPVQFGDGVLWLMLAFHPFSATVVLGIRFIFAWHRFKLGDTEASRRWSDGDMAGDGCDFSGVGRRSITDPLNIAAIANPVNPSSPEWRDRNIYGKH